MQRLLIVRHRYSAYGVTEKVQDMQRLLIAHLNRVTHLIAAPVMGYAKTADCVSHIAVNVMP
jgi:hypothetical protein